MKKRIIATVTGVLTCIACSTSVCAEAFPYKLAIESQNYMEDYLYLTLTDVAFESDACEALSEGINEWTLQRSENMENRIAELRDEAAQDAEELGDLFYGYNIYQQMRVSRADDRMLSILEESYEYLGDAAASGYLAATNFDVRTGKILELADVVQDEKTFMQDAAPYIQEYLDENYAEQFPDFSKEELQTLMEQGAVWYMNASGMVIVFEADLLGGMTQDNIEVPLTYESFAVHIREEYLLSENCGLYEMKENVPVLSGAEEEAFEAAIVSEVLEYEKEYTLRVNDRNKELGTFFYFGNMFFLKNSDGKNYVLYAADSSSGEYNTYLYQIDGNGIQKTDEIFGTIDSANSTPDALMTGSYISVLGDYHAVKSYYVDEQGKFAAEDDLYWIDGKLEERGVLVTKADIPAVIDGKEAVLSAGSSLKLLATDNQSKAIVWVMDTETEAELAIEKGKNGEYWNNKVGGLLESECIETLPYIG